VAELSLRVRVYPLLSFWVVTLSRYVARRSLRHAESAAEKKRHLQNADDILIAGASGARAPSRCSKKNMATVFSKGGKRGRRGGRAGGRAVGRSKLRRERGEGEGGRRRGG